MTMPLSCVQGIHQSHPAQTTLPFLLHSFHHLLLEGLVVMGKQIFHAFWKQIFHAFWKSESRRGIMTASGYCWRSTPCLHFRLTSHENMVFPDLVAPCTIMNFGLEPTFMLAMSLTCIYVFVLFTFSMWPCTNCYSLLWSGFGLWQVLFGCDGRTEWQWVINDLFI